MFQILLCQIRN